MHVMPEEVVTAGAVLFEVMNTDTLWVRVPVYVGETSDIAIDQPADVGDLASRPGQTNEKAQPIAAPPTATALSSTVDLYYQLSNTSGALRPGQRVSVQLPLVGDAEERVVPWSAIVQDIHGGDWVYEKIAAHKFAAPSSGETSGRFVGRSRTGPRRRNDDRHDGSRRNLRDRVLETDSAMNWLVTTSLKLRVLVLAASIVLVIVGAQTLRTAPLDVFPEFAEPLVEIQTEAPGLSTEEVESLITIPLENGLKGTPWLKTLRSKSVLGLSSVVLIFPRRHRSGSGPSIRAGTIGHGSQPASRRCASPGDAFAAFNDQPRDEDRHHVGHAVANGNERAGQMDDPAEPDGHPGCGQRGHLGSTRSSASGARRSRTIASAQTVTLDAVQRAVADAVSLTGGGFVDTPNQRIAVRQMTGVDGPDDLGEAIVDYRAGSPILLRDVAKIVEGYPLPIGDAVINNVKSKGAESELSTARACC